MRNGFECWRLVCSLLVCGSLSGCGSYQYTPYPYQWSKPTADRFGECPVISGRYNDNATEITEIPSSGKQIAPSRTDASPFLAVNLAGSFSDAWRWWRWVDIEQVDDQSLNVTMGPSGPGSEPTQHVLRRASGDFECADGKLQISGATESLAKGSTETATVMTTVILIGLGSGGVRLDRRLFTRATNGDLMMEVQRTAVGTIFFIPRFGAHTYYLRWAPYRTPESDPADTRSD